MTMPLVRGSRSNRQSDLAPDEFQNVHEANKSTWDQMMELFLTPCNPNPRESRLSNDEKSDTRVVTREQPEEEDILDYVFENVESAVCRGDADTENETNGKELEGGSVHSLRQNNSLIDREDVEAYMSADGNSQKLSNDDLHFEWRTGKIVKNSKQDANERTTKTSGPIDDKQKGNPDLLDCVFQRTESFVCGESITPEEMKMNPDEEDGIIGACSFHDQDPEPPTTKRSEPVNDEQKGNPDLLDCVFESTESFVCGESITPEEMKMNPDEGDGIIGACSFHDQDPDPPTTKPSEPVNDKQKGKADGLDRVFESTETLICGKSIMPEEMKMDPDEDDGIIGACSFHDQDAEPPIDEKEPAPPTRTKEVVQSPKVEDEQKNKEEGPDMLDRVFENTETFVCGERTKPQAKKLDAADAAARAMEERKRLVFGLPFNALIRFCSC